MADWDGKDRSNDEEESMRSQWIDKATGKVINLSNYSFSKMSGWNGYQFEWSAWRSDIADKGGTVIRKQTSIRVTNFGPNPNWTIAYIEGLDSIGSFNIRVTGLKTGARLIFSGANSLLTINEDGIYTVPADASAPLVYFFQANGYSANENADLLIEQLPVYPGALVSDGVDDYGQTRDVIDEEVGTMLVFADEELVANAYIMRSINSDVDAAGVACWKYNNLVYLGRPNTIVDTSAPLFVLTRTPASPNYNMTVGAGDYSYGFGKSALRRLILIQERLDDAQVEFLKWKVGKEYRDWCIANGYDYAIDEMLNN